MLKFIPTEKHVKILTEPGGIELGYINENNVFFPNNNMMFKLDWMREVTRYMVLTSLSNVHPYRM